MGIDPFKLTGHRFSDFTMTTHLPYKIRSKLHLPAQGDPTAISISPEGTLIAVGSTDGHVRVWCLFSYDLLCQASPPLKEDSSADVQIGNMTWMPNGLLVFSRRNGLMGMLLVGKVRNEFGKWATNYYPLPRTS